LALLDEDRLVEQLVLLAAHAELAVRAPLVHQVTGSHRTLLSLLHSQFGRERLLVDGQPHQGQPLSAGASHDIALMLDPLPPGCTPHQARATFASARALGAESLIVAQGSQSLWLSDVSVCSRCGAWFHPLRPTHFHQPCPHCQGASCARCQGTGLHPEAAAVRWQGLRLPELLALSVDQARQLLATAAFPPTATRLQSEMASRLAALDAVGLGYVALDRAAPTLSRGEAQRVRLAVLLNSRLEDMVHVLDEPTIGQHPADVQRLMPAFRQLKGPVVFVEHDRLAAAEADEAIDLGPGAGRQGGKVVFQGPLAGLWQADTPTGRSFGLRSRVPLPPQRPEPERFLWLRDANLRNLRGIDVPIPLERLTVITGVSGSGKSTLVEDVLVASLVERQPVGCRAVEGPWLRATLVDQQPIGRNPRSNPATYTKLADLVRDYMSRATGLSPSHFSFNRPEGACPTCKGLGATEVAMLYLTSTWIPCTDCGGQRFSEEVLAARVSLGGKSWSLAELYELPISEARDLLLGAGDPEGAGDLQGAERRAARGMLDALCDVGLGYLSLGQASPTLSGGEAQRVKLAKYLGRRRLAGQMLILDEPSTGLHPQDIRGLLVVLDRLVRSGATLVIVEHNTDIMRAADWVIDLGPGAGPGGGELLYAGPPLGLLTCPTSLTGQALHDETKLVPRAVSLPPDDPSPAIRIRGASAHNLRRVDVDIPKGKLTVVTGVSGSGKSSLVGDVLESEARRRFLESLSMYERQSTHEGPEAPVDEVSGLGVALSIEGARGRFNRRATVGTDSEIAHHLAVLLAWLGERACPACGMAMGRATESGSPEPVWRCPGCGLRGPIGKPRHFSPFNYYAACPTCHGVGTQQVPRPEKLMIHPELSICGGAMYSPGFFPKGYLCKTPHHGHAIVLAVAERYGFDLCATPWQAISPAGQQAFLFGDPEPYTVELPPLKGKAAEAGVRQATWTYPGFYGWVRDWDVGGTYTDTVPCPACGGGRLRYEFAAVTLGGHNRQALSEMPLSQLQQVMLALPLAQDAARLASDSLELIRRRLTFMGQVGLGYLHLNRVSATLSAGEAQRIRLAGLLGSGLTALTLLLDEPTRGMHPREVAALRNALWALRDEGHTVIVVEHDLLLIRAADQVIDMGPGAGAQGGQVVAQGSPSAVASQGSITGRWLRGAGELPAVRQCPAPKRWLTIRQPRENNLRGQDVRLPLGRLVGICGVSGSGKSTLIVDTLGRAVAPTKHTTSVAQEPLEPGAHGGIAGAPKRAIIVDQSRAGIVSPGRYLDLEGRLLRLYAASEDAQALGWDEKTLGKHCATCGGSGSLHLDMGFLPDVHVPCESCNGSGYPPEAWEVRLDGLALPELLSLTLEQVLSRFGQEEGLARPLQAACDVGLGYLVVRQPGYSLSGGEVQRLKIAKELCRQTSAPTLYLLDEPTVGQHLADVARLAGVLQRLADGGHTVVVVEHHPHLLAACDWLVELGPGGGPEGGWLIAQGPPALVAAGNTPTTPYLREVLTAGETP
jgi:excinuclease ABC subunit A